MCDPLSPTRMRRRGPGRFLLAIAGVFAVALGQAGCSLPITEPPHYPPAIRNLLDEPINIYDESTEDSDDRAFVVRLDPGDVHELPREAALCYGRELVAIGSPGELGRLEDRCLIDSDAVWVLHVEGHYVTDYYGKETVYWPD